MPWTGNGRRQRTYTFAGRAKQRTKENKLLSTMALFFFRSVFGLGMRRRLVRLGIQGRDEIIMEGPSPCMPCCLIPLVSSLFFQLPGRVRLPGPERVLHHPRVRAGGGGRPLLHGDRHRRVVLHRVRRQVNNDLYALLQLART